MQYHALMHIIKINIFINYDELLLGDEHFTFLKIAILQKSKNLGSLMRQH